MDLVGPKAVGFHFWALLQIDLLVASSTRPPIGKGQVLFWRMAEDNPVGPLFAATRFVSGAEVRVNVVESRIEGLDSTGTSFEKEKFVSNFNHLAKLAPLFRQIFC